MSTVQAVVSESEIMQIILQSPGNQGPPGPSGVAEFFDVFDAAYTLDDANRSKIGRFRSDSATTITVPAGLSSNFDCMILQLGDGQITFTAGAGATIRSGNSAFKTAYKYAAANVICIGTNEYLISGEVVL